MGVSIRDAMLTASLVTLLLAFKFWLSNMMWGGAKAKAGLRSPEDPINNKSPTEEARLEADRRGRVVANDLETIPLGLILLWAAVVCTIGGLGSRSAGKTGDLLEATMALAIIFAVARVLHTIVYSLGLNMYLRSLAWFVGQLAAFGLGIVAVIAADSLPDVEI